MRTLFPRLFDRSLLVTITILLGCCYSSMALAHLPIMLTPDMVNTTNSSNPEALFDNDAETYWFIGWNKQDYPADTILDLGENYDITRIDLYDISGNGLFEIYAGSPGNWSATPIVSDPLTGYLVWSQHVQTVSSRYLLLRMDTRVARVGEMMVYGTSSSGPAAPVFNSIDPINVTADTQTSLTVTANNTTSLTADNLPAFVSFTDTGSGTGELSIPASAADVGNYQFSLTATGLGGTASANINLTVTAASTGVDGICEIISSTELVGSGNVGDLFDEAAVAGDPANDDGGEPENGWFSGWDRSVYPVSGYIDLGSEKQLNELYWFNTNGDGGFTITAGSPGSWNTSTLVDDDLRGYKVWEKQAVNVSTRYLRFEMQSRSSNVAEVVIYGDCGSTSVDTIAPADTADLTAVAMSASSIKINWTAPGDDLTSGSASSYDLRYSPMPIGLSNFSIAGTVPTSAPQQAGSAESATINNLLCETEYFFVLKSEDEAGNPSGLSNLSSVTTGSCSSGANEISVTLNFDSALANSTAVAISELRFDKDFAYSLTIDDTSPMEYANVFPILSGGTSSDNVAEAGFNYSDGCGNQRPFKAGLSVNGGQLNESENEFYTSWPLIEEMYQAGWDIYNHSLNHCAWDCDDYDGQVAENTVVIKNRLGHTTNHFVVPSGDYNGYLGPAFNNGMSALHDQVWTMPGNGGLQIDGVVDLNQFQLHRNTLETEETPFGEDIIAVANMATNDKHYWFSEYAHRIGRTGVDWFITVDKNDFRDYMALIEANYGERVWMAPLQEVYEYLLVRQNIVISSTQINGNQMTVTLDTSAVPENMRRYALSLKVDANVVLSNSSAVGASVCSSADGLINLEW